MASSYLHELKESSSWSRSYEFMEHSGKHTGTEVYQELAEELSPSHQTAEGLDTLGAWVSNQSRESSSQWAQRLKLEPEHPDAEVRSRDCNGSLSNA